MCRIITTPIEDYFYHSTRKEREAAFIFLKNAKKIQESFEKELKIATEKELKNDERDL